MRAVERYGVRTTLFALALTLVAIPFAVLVDQVVRDGPLVDVDAWTADRLHDLVRDAPAVVDALQVVSFLGKPTLFNVVCIPVALWLVWRRRPTLALYLVTTTVLGGLIDIWVKAAVGRDRPFVDDPVSVSAGHSFPSGHAMTATVAYGALLLVFLPLVPPRRRTAAIGFVVALVVAIGFTRVALGVHYVTDVVGGFVLGVAWLLLATAAFEIWRTERGLRPTRPLSEGVEPVA